jgi:hypothetical protein
VIGARVRRNPGARLGAFLCAAIFAASGVGCAASGGRVDRRVEIELAYQWVDDAEARVAYYAVERDGTFRSAGGRKAREREATFRATLSDAELARFVELARATGYASRPDESGSGEQRSEIEIRDADGRHAFIVRGADASVEELRAYLAELSMRQYRDVLDALPEAGPRER